MKKIIECSDAEGLESLLGARVTLLCLSYFYTGILAGVNETCVLLTSPSIIYETGPWTEKKWTDVQALPTEKLYVQRAAIEAFGMLK